jgi:broad specificity phosphatase PhoE
MLTTGSRSTGASPAPRGSGIVAGRQAGNGSTLARHLIFCRHGESEFNVRGIVNGDPRVACALSPLGRRQSRALGDELSAEPITLCVTSEFQRATQTAAIALDGRKIPTTIEPRLNDPRLGRLEQTPLPGYLEWLRTNEPTACPPDGGESQVQAIDRYCHAFNDLLERPERCILVVCHALPVSVAVSLSRSEPPALRREYPPVGPARPFRVRFSDLRNGVARALEELSRSRG